MTGPHFHPNFLYVPFFPIPLFTKWGTTAVYLFVMGTGICAMVPLLPFIDRPKIVKGGGRPVTVVHKQHSTCLFSLFFFFHFPICCVFARFVMVTRRGVGLAGRNSNLRSQSVQYDAV
jgi:hypothetical protein